MSLALSTYLTKIAGNEDVNTIIQQIMLQIYSLKLAMGLYRTRLIICNIKYWHCTVDGSVVTPHTCARGSSSVIVTPWILIHGYTLTIRG